MINTEFSKAISQAITCGHDESVYNILSLLQTYSSESGINLLDVREQVLCMLSEIENYTPETNDLKRVNLLCKTYKLD